MTITYKDTKEFNAQELQDTAILIPSIELQERFSSSAETVKKSKLTIQQSLDKLEVLKKAWG